MTRFWLAPLAEILARGEGAMLVHVVGLKGSGPRDVGAQMLVTEQQSFGSIGGGELENLAMRTARDRLHSGQAGIERHALGPDLNQCCGGSVTLAYEPFAPADHVWTRKLIAAAGEPSPLLRKIRIGEAGSLRRSWEADEHPAFFAVRLSEDAVEIAEHVNPSPQALFLFGAGHVGKAVARTLEPLGFAMTWIDARAGELPEPPLNGVKQLALAMPELIVDEAPPDGVFLVMTHSHALDQTICEAILRRGDFAYLGLIGSDTKRARFVKRLAAAGIGEKDLARLVCPIGLPVIASKEPAAIAASLAADLLIRREKHLLSAKGEALHGRR